MQNIPRRLAHPFIRTLRLALFLLIFSVGAPSTPAFSQALSGSPFSLVGKTLSMHYLGAMPILTPLGLITMDEAMETQRSFLDNITDAYGAPVGYKAALTSRKIQARFGATEPVRGTLLKRMLLPSGVTLDLREWARPVAEGDLVVRVGSEAINDVTTAKEAVLCIDAVYPFLELPDLIYAEDVRIEATDVAAANGGARYGVLGDAVSVKDGEGWHERLQSVRVVLVDGDGMPLAEGTGAELMGDPMKALLWVRDSLKKEGRRLKKGDLISLGAITKMVPIKPSTKIKAVYTGLDRTGDVNLEVSFE